MLLDHISLWIRTARRNEPPPKRDPPPKRTAQASPTEPEPQPQPVVDTPLKRVASVLASIDQGLMANAASQCKAYARSLMHLEQLIRLERDSGCPSQEELQRQYERLHELYALLEEPDGMEGVSPMILAPSLEHQIRQHESTGKWTSAQSCWEVRLQHDPDNLDYHLGLLRCLRNLGHYGRGGQLILLA